MARDNAIADAECADALTPLLSKGKPRYSRQPSEPADESWILANATELKHLFVAIPSGNGKYTSFMRAALQLMQNGKYGEGSLAFQIAICYLIAAMARMEARCHS